MCCLVLSRVFLCCLALSCVVLSCFVCFLRARRFTYCIISYPIISLSYTYRALRATTPGWGVEADDGGSSSGRRQGDGDTARGFSMRALTGGMTNAVFRCSKHAGENRTVLLRSYGKGTEVGSGQDAWGGGRGGGEGYLRYLCVCVLYLGRGSFLSLFFVVCFSWFVFDHFVVFFIV